MTDNGDSPLPPFPFGDLPLPPTSNGTSDELDTDGLPSWLSGALPFADSTREASSPPDWPLPMPAAPISWPQPPFPELFTDTEVQPGRPDAVLQEDTLSDFPQPLDAPPSNLTQTPPPVAKPLPAIVAEWQTHTTTLMPMLEDNETVYLFRTTIRPLCPTGYQECTVTFSLPTGVKQVHANRKPKARKGQLSWNLGTIAPTEVVPLVIKIPAAVFPIAERETPRTIVVNYKPMVAGHLTCTVDGPPILAWNEPQSIVVSLTNTGTAAIESISIRAVSELSPAVSTTATITLISPGESQDVVLSLTPSQVGAQSWRITAEGDQTGLTSAIYQTKVVAPSLELNLHHESMMRVDGDTDITLELHNDSPVMVRQATVVLAIPEELSFVSTSIGTYDSSLSHVGCLIPNLPAGASRTVTVRLRGFAPGLVRLQAQAEAVDVAAVTRVSSLFVEVDARATSSTLDNLLAAMHAAAPDDDETLDTPSIAKNEGSRHLLFQLMDTVYAVPIQNVREVIRPTPVTPVPGVPDWLPGVANIRGDVVSIVDLSIFLGVETQERANRGLLICASDDGQLVVGLLVTEVVGIRRLPAAQAFDSELLGDNRAAAYIHGICHHQNAVVPLLELNALLMSEELNLFQTA